MAAAPGRIATLPVQRGVKTLSTRLRKQAIIPFKVLNIRPGSNILYIILCEISDGISELILRTTEFSLLKMNRYKF